MHGRAGTPVDSYIEVSEGPEDWGFWFSLPPWLARLIGRLTGVEALVRLRREIPYKSTPAQFAAAALQKLGIHCDDDPAELASVPRTGRLIIVANHPFGALDGLMSMALLGALRPDLKIFANEDLNALHELEPVLLPIEVFGKQRVTHNARAMRNALRWLEGDGALHGVSRGRSVALRCARALRHRSTVEPSRRAAGTQGQAPGSSRCISAVRTGCCSRLPDSCIRACAP